MKLWNHEINILIETESKADDNSLGSLNTIHTENYNLS